MKSPRITLILLLNICFLSTSLSQNISLGFQGGIGKANIHVTRNTIFLSEKQIYDPILSYSLNGYIGYRSKSFWGLSLEPGFIKKGGNIVQETSYDQPDQKRELNYIQLPVLFDMYITKHLFLSVGAEFGYLIKAQTEYSNLSVNAYDLYNKYEVSGVAGIWYNLFDHFDFGLRFDRGLLNPTRVAWIDDYGNFTGQTTEYNQYFQLTIRVKK